MTAFATIVLLCLIILQLVDGISVVVTAGAEQCFFDQVKRGDRVFGSFSVFSGGQLDITVRITDPEEKVVFEEEDTSQESFAFVALKDGEYRMCFSNEASTITSKQLSFNLHIGNQLANLDVAKSHHLSPLENSVVSVSQAASQVRDEQKYLITRERYARDTNESTNSRVLWWSILENILLISLSLWKIFYLKGLFEQKRF